MSSYTPSDSTSSSGSTKTLVVRPGETVVIKKSWHIIKSIADNVSVTTNCVNLNQTDEDKVEYALYVETADILQNGDAGDYLTGVGTNSAFYAFSAPINITTFHDFGTSSGGIEQTFKAIVDVFPGGQALFTDARFISGIDSGNSGGTSSDNAWRAVVYFKSFPSVIEGLGFYLMYKNTANFGDPKPAYYIRIYPGRS